MDFAKSLLQKYGWKEGEGIGRNSDGILKPIKASLKFDTHGLGHNRADEFNNHWWEKAFNDAASNINVQKGPDQISVSLNNGESVEYSASGYSAKQFMKQKTEGKSYAGIFKKSKNVLHGPNASDSDSSDDEDVHMNASTPGTFTNVLSDRELLAACGGRTAHKGARHGLTLTGKLSRIEAQDRILLAQMQNTASNMASPENTADHTWTLVKKSKKQQNKDRSADVDMETDAAQSKLGSNSFDDSLVAGDGDTDYVIKSKSKKKKKEHRARDDGLAESLGSLTTDAVAAPATDDGDSHQEKRREKKKKRKLERANDESSLKHTVDGENEADAPAEKKRKKTSRKEKMREAIKMAEDRNGVDESDDGLEMNKFKKKKKKRKTATDADDFSSGDEANRRVCECNAIAEATQKPVTAQKVLKEQRKLAKIARKMERSLNC